MTPLEVHRRAQTLGLRIEPAGDKLAVFPKGRCPADFADVLREHKAELLNWLSRSPCPGWQSVPPENLPLDPTAPRPTPHNRERMIHYLIRQGCDCPGQLTAWLVNRENSYYEGVGRKWDCALLAYAASRDCVCWQLNRSERDVLELLSGFDECSRKEP